MSVEITDAPIDIKLLIEKTRNPDAGALVTFQGTVRRMTGDLEVDSLIYESYRDMAIKTINEIINEAMGKHDILEINVVHRLGTVGLTEDSVAICCSSPHRKEAFRACEYVIDEIKTRVPIWKKDVPREGPPRWRD